MRRMNDFTLMTEFVQQNPLGRNRYKDVGCLDNFRVILTIGNVQYIHANYVSTPVSAKRFICTQAPLPKTCPDFWNMVVQEKSVAILMLCNFIEQNAKKCAEYFPTQEGPPMAFEGDVFVSFKKQEMFSDSDYSIKRRSKKVAEEIWERGAIDVVVPGAALSQEPSPVSSCCLRSEMFFFKRKGKSVQSTVDTKLELTQREDAPSKVARRKGKRRQAKRTRVQGKTVEEGSKRAVKKRTGQTMEEDTPSVQQKASLQTAASAPSIQGKSVEEMSRRVSKAAKRAQVKVFVEETFKKGVKGLIAEFKSMKRVNDFSKMTEFVAQNAEGRNRYKDVGCLDNDRVIIRIGPVSYIHANYVSSPTNPKRFICTQAPLPKTCPDFWYMVVQEKSVAILMLCNFIEQNAKKCAEYFPVEEDKPVSFEGGVTVSLKKQEPLPFPFETRIHILVRSLEVSVPGQPVHACQHYHWQDWPDRGVPDADLAPIVLLSRLKDNTAPIIVHCSAGIGRTGSITEHQYLYIHQVLLLYLKKTKYLDDSVTPYLEAFTRDYINATKGF
ncbi:hypothetical protein GCK32_007507 [Trichostrongylus colubriformis]|uniref:Protein-tyrosine phosphatase n=1 Tax=Trichostrongylus colubriformis TaxID=6319 RepID=A0AAN8J2H2_TRICO